MNYLQITDDQELSPLRRKCMQSVRDAMASRDSIEIVKIKHNPYTPAMVKESDRIKFSMAAQEPELCYVDTDCFISTLLCMDEKAEKRPWFATYSYADIGAVRPDFYYFYVNGCCDFFKEHLDPEKMSPSQYGPTPELIASLSGYNVIPENDYIHMYDTMRLVIMENKYAPAISLLKKYEAIIRKLSRGLEMQVDDLNEFNNSIRSK